MQIVRTVTSYDYLDFDEFLHFMERYLPWEMQQFQVVFEQFDVDKSGEMSSDELKALLTHLGFLPIRTVIKEALGIVDKDGSGNLDFEELTIFLAVFRRAEGFSQGEVSELRRLFDQFAKQPGGVPKKSLPAEALCDALVQFFGVHVAEYASKLEGQIKNGHGLQKSSLAVAESGKSENLSFTEFLIFARKTREAALEKLKYTFISAKGAPSPSTASNRRGSSIMIKEPNMSDIDSLGPITEMELRRVLKGMGYTPLQEPLAEVMHDVLAGSQETELDFYDFVNFILVYRQREGFKKDDVQDMRRLFVQFDVDESGEVSAMELKELFRHLGYRVSMDQVHLFVAQLDENNSNCLDFREYLRLMQVHREQELQNIASIWNQFKDSSTGCMASNHLPNALRALHHDTLPRSLESKQSLFPRGLDFEAFVKVVDSCRSELVARERKKAGFTDERIAELRIVFDNFDHDHNGEIDSGELLDVLTEFGWNPKDPQEQAELLLKLQVAKDQARAAGVHASHDSIEFWTFVQLSRMLETEHEQAEEELMNRLMAELHFSSKEVDDFRQIFMNKKHELVTESQAAKPVSLKETNGLPRDDVRRLVRSLGISLIGENKAKLDAKLKTVGCDESTPLDFPGFLRLMHWLTTSDIAQTGDVVEKK